MVGLNKKYGASKVLELLTGSSVSWTLGKLCEDYKAIMGCSIEDSHVVLKKSTV